MENVDSSENSPPASLQRVIDWQEVRADERRLEVRRAQLLAQGQKLYARIRPSSKYYGQTNKGALFAVVVDDFPGYPVRGGPGGKYRLADVDLFASFTQDLPPVQITFEISP